MNKNFSILKWIIFPILVLAFGCGISYVSITIFGLAGSVPSILLICVCLAISLIFILHTSNHRIKSAMIAAFTFECLGITALGITLICSIIILRQFSGVSETIKTNNEQELKVGAQTTEQLKLISQMKSASAQRNAVKIVKSDETKSQSDSVTLSSIYDKAESYLLYPLIGEASVYLLGLLIVFGLVQFNEVKTDEPSPPIQSSRHTARNTFLAANAPLRVSSAHRVDNGNGFALSLSAQGEGVAIRFQERGSPAKHVIRIPNAEAEASNLKSKTYEELARWSLAKLKEAGKDSKPIYKSIEETL